MIHACEVLKEVSRLQPAATVASMLAQGALGETVRAALEADPRIVRLGISRGFEATKATARLTLGGMSAEPAIGHDGGSRDEEDDAYQRLMTDLKVGLSRAFLPAGDAQPLRCLCGWPLQVTFCGLVQRLTFESKDLSNRLAEADVSTPLSALIRDPHSSSLAQRYQERIGAAAGKPSHLGRQPVMGKPDNGPNPYRRSGCHAEHVCLSCPASVRAGFRGSGLAVPRDILRLRRLGCRLPASCQAASSVRLARGRDLPAAVRGQSRGGIDGPLGVIGA